MKADQAMPTRTRGRLVLLAPMIPASCALPLAASAADLAVRITGLRAPRFDEAMLQVAADAKELVIDVKVAQ